MKKLKLILIPMVSVALLSGCKSYEKTGKWAPDGFNTTVQLDKRLQEPNYYMGLSWSLK